MKALGEIVGDSAGIRRLREQLEHILKRVGTAPRPPTILLRGETGTGKGLVARTMHRAGPRARAPFVDVNCAAIPDNLLEAELFGYERGAFTDARQAKPGLFQLAHRGTLFLDEIGMLSPALQAKLLKVLEDGAVRRLGGTRAEPVDVWIVSATNEDLAEALRARRFREDLYHRLAALSLELPPLRERGSDVLVLAERFLARACADYGLTPKNLARDARAALAAYGWPGNVRELGNVIERVALLADESVVTATMLALPGTTTADDRPGVEPGRAMSSRDQMRAHLLQVLAETGGNISQTAIRLGVARNTVLARMARFGLNASAAASPAGSRPGVAPRRDASATAPTEVSVPLVATSRAVWEPRRVALLRVDVVVEAAGSVDGSRALDEMLGKVQTFGGEIVEIGTSAFVAAFGLEAVEDAPVRAALAALAIRKASERAHRDGAGPHVKIVVHVTHVLVSQLQGPGTIDLDGKRAAWKAIEALVDLDQRDTIVVSEAAASFLERRFEIAPASANDAVPFRRLTQRERTGFGLGGRPLSRFVGRDAELRLVTDRLASADRGHGQVIGIVGEPGVGKSRFVYELTRLDAVQGWRVLGCAGVSHGSTTPFLPISDLLRRYFAIEDADEPETIREKVTETILSRHEALNPSLTPLLSLLDVAVDDPAWRNLDPRQQRQRSQDAVKRLLLDESRIQPLVVIIEDLHWIDTATQALLDSLVESLPTARLLLLVNYRPEYQHGWATKTYYSRLLLDALTPERAIDLLHALLGGDPGLEPLTRLLVERGNPFVIEESVETLVETGALAGARGAYRLTKPIEAIEIPATVQMILAARIERLSGDDKQLLQTASVIGKDVPFVLLHAVAGIAEDDVHRGLEHLRAAEFLYETRLSPDAEYTFKHALTHDVTYGTLLSDRRRDLHARIVGAIERVYPDRLTEHVERLAHHAARGEMWEQAVTYLRQAGAKALARSANREAVSCFEQALVALDHRGETLTPPERSRQELEVRTDLGPALAAIRGYGATEVEQAYLRAHALCRDLGDPPQLLQVLQGLWRLYVQRGTLPTAHAYAAQILSLAERRDDPSDLLVAHLSLGFTLYYEGDWAGARDHLEQRLSIGDLEGRRALAVRYGQSPEVQCLTFAAPVLWALGYPDRALRRAQEACALARELAHPYSIVGALYWSAVLHQRRGEPEAAHDVADATVRLATEHGLSQFAAQGAFQRGWALTAQGQIEQGLAQMHEALKAQLAAGTKVAFPAYVALLADAYGRAGRGADGLRMLDEALASSKAGAHPYYDPELHRLKGELTLRQETPDDAAAEACFQRAIDGARRQQARSWELRAATSLARLWGRQGKLAEGRALVAPVYGGFTEGFETADLRDAKAWLDA